ncbi:hypothetical protein BU23DRAFT_655223 [Bimuria novae-zelandiae CBS 107.79]|uniref:Uncharacterized protein n=1 Tax=Bimuria novae-zelandiae CBS 107.79 TaxID=1447943 RepID=A0A6A5UVT9_9PLEO|nr:hypothetical protein BU23DRAFT_655223 [Bimuria novae-zelandiae CBS 107.79]
MVSLSQLFGGKKEPGHWKACKAGKAKLAVSTSTTDTTIAASSLNTDGEVLDNYTPLTLERPRLIIGKDGARVKRRSIVASKRFSELFKSSDTDFLDDEGVERAEAAEASKTPSASSSKGGNRTESSGGNKHVDIIPRENTRPGISLGSKEDLSCHMADNISCANLDNDQEAPSTAGLNLLKIFDKSSRFSNSSESEYSDAGERSEDGDVLLPASHSAQPDGDEVEFGTSSIGIEDDSAEQEVAVTKSTGTGNASHWYKSPTGINWADDAEDWNPSPAAESAPHWYKSPSGINWADEVPEGWNPLSAAQSAWDAEENVDYDDGPTPQDDEGGSDWEFSPALAAPHDDLSKAVLSQEYVAASHDDIPEAASPQDSVAAEMGEQSGVSSDEDESSDEVANENDDGSDFPMEGSPDGKVEALIVIRKRVRFALPAEETAVEHGKERVFASSEDSCCVEEGSGSFTTLDDGTHENSNNSCINQGDDAEYGGYDTAKSRSGSEYSEDDPDGLYTADLSLPQRATNDQEDLVPDRGLYISASGIDWTDDDELDFENVAYEPGTYTPTETHAIVQQAKAAYEGREIQSLRTGTTTSRFFGYDDYYYTHGGYSGPSRSLARVNLGSHMRYCNETLNEWKEEEQLQTAEWGTKFRREIAILTNTTLDDANDEDVDSGDAENLHDILIRTLYVDNPAIPSDRGPGYPHILAKEPLMYPDPTDETHFLLQYVNPRLCDAVATLLHETAPSILTAFLDPHNGAEVVEWRHAPTHQYACTTFFRRSGNDVTVARGHAQGFGMLITAYFKASIGPDGLWTDTFAFEGLASVCATTGAFGLQHHVQEDESVLDWSSFERWGSYGNASRVLDEVDELADEDFALDMGRGFAKRLLMSVAMSLLVHRSLDQVGWSVDRVVRGYGV